VKEVDVLRLLALTETQWEDYRPFVDTALLACGDWEVPMDAEPLGGAFTIAAALAERLEQELTGRILLFPPIPLFHAPLLAVGGDGSQSDCLPTSMWNNFIQAFVQARRDEAFQHIIIVVSSLELRERFRLCLADEVKQGLVKVWHWHEGEDLAVMPTQRRANRNMATFLVHARRKSKEKEINATAEKGKVTIRAYFQQLLEITHRMWGVE